ncbi:MAG: hypothetical protein FJY97_20175 [candidate division Zixibacteria bacterium]|nr:hypothetical protein [candidate division Zixibacteria bacterium]
MLSQYATWIDKKTPLLKAAGILLAASAAGFLSQQETRLTTDFTALLESGTLSIALFVSALLLLVGFGIFVDDRPGKSLTLAVAMLPALGVMHLLLPWAVSSAWTPVWNGLMIGLVGVVQQIAWRTGARCAVVVFCGTLYALVVSTGLSAMVSGDFSTSRVMGLLCAGATTLVMTGVPVFRLREQIKAARRESVHRHLTDVALSTAPVMLTWGGAGLAGALAAAGLSEGPAREFALLTAMGVGVGMTVALIVPAPLKWAIQETASPPPPERGGRRETRRSRA